MMPPDLPDDDLTPDEARALAALRESVAPSAGLSERVRADLRRRGAFRAPWRRWAGPAAAAAAMALAYVAGARSTNVPVAATPPAGPQYVLFLMNAPATQWPDSMSAEKIVGAFRDWAQPLAVAGRLVLADELAPEHQLVDATSVRAGDVATGVNGFFVVTANDDSTAIELARTLPSVRHGGVVAVQRLMSR